VNVVNTVVAGLLVVLIVMFIVSVVRTGARTKKLLEVCQEILDRIAKGNTNN
jgi:hypothetical protein